MYFDNGLTQDDMRRMADVCPNPPPAMLMAGSFAALLEAIDTYTHETVHPVMSGMLALTDREKVLLGLYYRSVGFCRTAIELKSAVHHQSLISAERSVIELYVDMELVHRDAIPDAVTKVMAFTDWQKLKAARRRVAFYAKHPDLDKTPSKATLHRDFIVNNEQRIVDQAAALWGPKSKPEHWSGINLINRGELLGKDVEYLMMKDYDRRNFFVHTGLTGILNMTHQNFEQICMFALTQIGECMLKELPIVGTELKLAQAIEGYEASLEAIEKVQEFAFADKVLQMHGEPQRFFMHKGQRPIVTLS